MRASRLQITKYVMTQVIFICINESIYEPITGMTDKNKNL